MRRLPTAATRGVCLAFACGLLAGCAPGTADTQNGSGGRGIATGGSGGSASGPGTGAAGPPGGGAGAFAGGGAKGTGGIGGTATGGASATGGSPAGSGGMNGAGGRAPSAGGSNGASGGGAGSSGPPNCVLPAIVGFKAHVRPFLITTCGDGNTNSGCHVIDTMSTVSAGGFDHAYDWITAGAHASSCPETPTPMRFQVSIAVINASHPSSCSRSRQMPPPDATGGGLRTPLTPCQVATLQAWLNEPLVTQMHRADDSSPTTPYPMPPYN